MKNLETIVQLFEIAAPANLSFEPLTAGHINQTFKVLVGDTPQYVLQKLNTTIFKEPHHVMSNIQTVANHLKSKRYPKNILEFYKTKDGAFVIEEESGAWRLTDFIDHSVTYLKADSEVLAFKTALAFGEYLKYLSDLPTENMFTIIKDFHNAKLRIRQFQDALQRPPSVERLKNAHNELIFIEKYIDYFNNYQPIVPTRIAHNDTKVSNILFDEKTDEVSCIIDLDLLQPDSLLSDFGDMVRAATPQLDENDTNIEGIEMRLSYFEALVSGFVAELKDILTNEEKDNLIFGAKRTVFVQALRFLADYLNDDIYYKIHYPEQNLMRARNQLSLFKSILQQEQDMISIIKKA